MDTTNYKLEKGDTVRVTGCRGILFNRNNQKLKLAHGVELGVECVLRGSQDDDLEVELPRGILADDRYYIHMACVELVKKGKPNRATIMHDPVCKLFEVRDGADEHFVSKIQYEYIPKEVAEVCSKVIKEAYDARH